MEQAVKEILDHTKDHMEDAVSRLKKELGKIRAGKPNPAILNGLKVDYYGSPTPLDQAAQISVTDARTLTVKPFEKSLLTEIEKAISQSKLDLNPTNNGDLILLHFPPLTKETRSDLVKQTGSLLEKGKVSTRSIRKDANEKIKKLEEVSEDMKKTVQGEVQKITDTFTKKMEEVFESKKIELMTL